MVLVKGRVNMCILRLFHAILVAGLLLMVTCFGAQAAPARAVVSLDGDWDFATDPEGVGETQKWYFPEVKLPAMPLPGYAPEATGTIRVPGIWDNQGYGTQTDTLWHNMPGKGWYRRHVQIPSAWSGKRIFLCIGGVHRYSKVWVNGRYFGEHIGFLSAFEYDLSNFVKAGETAHITIQVDSKQRWEVDAMYGAGNLADFMMTEWGGIWGHVKLEARDEAWLSELCIRTTNDDARCSASAILNGEAGRADGVQLEVSDQDGRSLANGMVPLTKALAVGETVAVSVTIPDATLWSPDQPYVYQARLSLLRDGKVIDTVQSGFGIREIVIDGPYILLNGKRLMLCGYGDDHIYPKEMAFSVDKALHLDRLRLIKSYGFNHVRHHSTTMPDEYYEACDEVGIMPNVEFPIVYRQFIPGTGSIWKTHVAEGTDPAPALETYFREWAASIKRHRNHPSVLCWVMGNEMYEGQPFGSQFEAIARQLDPTRPFVDTDGVFSGIFDPKNDRDSLDIYFYQFDVFANPIDTPDKFVCPKPRKPMVSHETGNYVTFTRPDAIDAFTHNVKPYWLTPAMKRLDELGYRDEAELWAEKSEYLYMLCHKYNTEALRKNAYISGHHWWLFQDYWTSSNGIVDFYFQPKGAITPEDVRKIVNDVVLLQDGFATTYRGKAKLSTAVSVSNFSFAPFTSASALLRVKLGEAVISENLVAVTDLEQGAINKLGDVALQLPDVTTPTPLTLSARLTLGDKTYINDWIARVYPAVVALPNLSGLPVYASRAHMPFCEGFGAKPIPTEQTLSERAIYVAGSFDKRMVNAVEKGAALVLLGDGAGLLPTRSGKFRTSWWKAGHGASFEHFPVNYSRNNCGTLVYDHPVTRAMAPDGWCDAGWYDLIQDGHQFVLEKAPEKPNVIIRALPGLAAIEDKAMLFEVCVGKGRLIASGLNHEKAKGSSAHQWLVARMLEHAASGPKPTAAWPVSMLRERALPSGPYITGFRSLIKNDCEEGHTPSYRGETIKHYICRQTTEGKRISWKADSVPSDWEDDNVIFVFSGGFGWQAEPRTEGFQFRVNDVLKLRFDLPEDTNEWASNDGAVKLRYVSKWRNDQDDAGLFYVVIGRDNLKAGEPVQFSVESMGSGSKRWFGLAPYTNLGMR
jgi:beta-galactosidase